MDVVEDVCDRVIIMNDGRIVADDAVADLIDVFRTFAYRVVAEPRDDGSGLDDATVERLREEYGAESFDHRGDRTAFEVTLGDPARLYDLMDDLRAAGLLVRSVESVDPDLEDVFLELTDEDADGGEYE
jgi:ABC-2 type transport system ATP-binding protein